MAAWSQSSFLQALGWAMLNSLWQMALLFAGFSLFQYLFKLSPKRNYHLALGSLGTGLLWFIYTFFTYFNQGVAGTISTHHQLAPSSQSWNVILSSASVVYLLLLLIPAHRLFRNWRYIEHLKKSGLQKTALDYRLFVKKVAASLGIKHTVHVYLSNLVQSAVTVGFLKPVILLPIAAVNSLSPQQVEAVLLHELSHIKRHDFLINLMIMILQTLFYFNPFVKKLVSFIEFEREKCCDELVLQFQYDKISYAAALLQLEKNTLASEALFIAAAGKKHLLSRIEKIVGKEKKPRFTFHQFAGLFASFLVVLLVNSLLFVKQEVKHTETKVFTAFDNPLHQFQVPLAAETFSKANKEQSGIGENHAAKSAKPGKKQTLISFFPQPQPVDLNLIPVAYDASDELVTPEEKEQIAQTLETTKKILAKTKWKEVEASIGDGMTADEKKAAQDEYLKELNKVNWKTVEGRLKTEYSNLNWNDIDSKLNSALTNLKLDSLQNVYHLILVQLKKTAVQRFDSCNVILPVPDLSVQEVNALKGEINMKVDSIKIIRQRKIINF